MSSAAPAAGSAGADPHAGAQLALQLHAVMLEPGQLLPAAQAAACLVATALGARRVSLGWLRRDGSLALLASSDGQAAASAGLPVQPQEAGDPLLASLAECVDQQRVLAWPPLASAPMPGKPEAPAAVRPRTVAPPITVAHRTWLDGRGGAALSLPLVHQGELLGAWCLEWDQAAQREAQDLQQLEHLTAWMAPVLALMQANERAWTQRLRDGLAGWLRSEDQPQRRRWRALLLPALAVACLVGAWPASWHVGGQARLEGAVQRVLSAPTDGFLQQVHARPGDVVKAGQPLLDLADRDLQLERQRWQSQLAQQLEAHVAAQARADRGALAQHQAKADEAQAQLDLVDEKLSRSRLVAPFDAVVVQGDLAQQLGAPVKQGAELMTLAPQGAYRVIVEVDERDVAAVHLGQRGTLALSALPWDTQALQVTRISPVAKAVEGRNVFEVEAALAEPQGAAAAGSGLRPGLQGHARIETGQAGLAWQALRPVLAWLRLALWRLTP
ncbi:MAG: HlyD family efflux transporter periplasmic adaptor subunit [Rubrivivax sp.]|nr:HlyD family efflux transporter periplasmic adaptor subunit [Rubrivivax sp.]